MWPRYNKAWFSIFSIREWHIFHFLFPKQLEYMNLHRDITFYNKNQASTDNYLVCIPYLTNHKASFHRLCSSNTKKTVPPLKTVIQSCFSTFQLPLPQHLIRNSLTSSI